MRTTRKTRLVALAHKLFRRMDKCPKHEATIFYQTAREVYARCLISLDTSISSLIAHGVDLDGPGCFKDGTTALTASMREIDDTIWRLINESRYSTRVLNLPDFGNDDQRSESACIRFVIASIPSEELANEITRRKEQP